MARTRASLRRAAGFPGFGEAAAPTCPQVYSTTLLTAIRPGIPRTRDPLLKGSKGETLGSLSCTGHWPRNRWLLSDGFFCSQNVDGTITPGASCPCRSMKPPSLRGPRRVSNRLKSNSKNSKLYPDGAGRILTVLRLEGLAEGYAAGKRHRGLAGKRFKDSS